MAFRPGPSAARRLLQPTQPASTTAGPSEPRLRCNERRRRALARVARFAPRRCFRAAGGPDSRAKALGFGGGAPIVPSPARQSRSPHQVRVAPSRRLPASLPACREPSPNEAEAPSALRGRPPVEVSRVRSRLGFHRRRLCSRPPFRAPVRELLSQPDPLGHLSSRDRGSVDWRLDVARR